MFQVFGEKNEYSPPGEWAIVLKNAVISSKVKSRGRSLNRLISLSCRTNKKYLLVRQEGSRGESIQ